MRVAFVLNSLGAGGTERSTAVLLPALVERGIEPVVVCLRHTAEGDEQRVIDAGFDVRFVAATRFVPRVRELRRILRAIEPDVVHTAIFEADLAGRLAGFRLGPPVVSSLVNTSYDPARRSDAKVGRARLEVTRLLDAVTARWGTARVHAVSEGVAEANAAALHLPRERIDVIERGRDLAHFGPVTAERRRRVRAALGIDESTPVVLTVGRQEFQKGHDVLVRAIDAAWPDAVSPGAGPERPAPLVLVAGRAGNASEALRRALDAAAHPTRVRVLGHRDDVPDLLSAADVFVMPSRYEGTAGAVLEAFAMGVPVVASAVAGVVGVLEHDRNCLLVPIDDAPALGAAIERVLVDPALAARLASVGRADFAARFTLDRAADRMAEWYRAQAVDGGLGRPTTARTRP